MTKEFLQLFTDSYGQTFDDIGKARRKMVHVFPMADLGKNTDIVKGLNKAGAGIFFTPNPCKGGRKECDVTCIKWLYVDMDTGTKEEMRDKIKSSPIRPHIIVESKRSYHLYWRCDCIRAEFDKIIQGLIEFFDGDKAISSTNEVLRLPGYYHMKNPKEPFMVKVIYIDKNRIKQPLTPTQMLVGYPSTKKEEKRILPHLNEARTYNTYTNIKDIPILLVLVSLGIEVSRNNFIIENGEVTSASINERGNYVNRFSGKTGSGSTIDVAMHYGNMELPQAIAYLKKLGGIKDIDILLEKPIEEVDILTQEEKVFTWGTEGLDIKLSPIADDTFIVFAGESGAGKTAFCFDMAIKNASLGHKVLFLSLEMSTDSIFIRIAREYARITKAQWRDKKLISEDQRLLFRRKRKQLMENENLVAIGFQSGIPPSMENITDVIKRVNPDLVCVDNFDLIQKRGGDSTHDNENIISKKLLDLAKGLPKPIILVHHLKKGTDEDLNKPRNLNSLRGSGKIVHNADMVVLGFRPPYKRDQSDENKAKFTIVQLKDRDFGTGGYHVCYFYKGQFYDKRPLDTVMKDFNEVFHEK